MATVQQAANLDFGGVSAIIRALHNPVSSDPGSPVNGEIWYNSTSDTMKFRADGTTYTVATTDDVSAGGLSSSIFDAQTVLAAVTDNTPVAVTVGEGEVVGRLSGGNVGAVSLANLITALEGEGLDSDTLGGEAASYYLARANHTGTQLSSTISDFATAVQSEVDTYLDVESASAAYDTIAEIAAELTDLVAEDASLAASIAAKTDKYAENIGDNSATSIQVTHGLSSTDVIVQVNTISSGEVLNAQVTIDDANNVTLDFNSAPATDSIRVVVIG